jgi:ribosome-associated toxin RatA of RatAB toxin-antitoxin module
VTNSLTLLIGALAAGWFAAAFADSPVPFPRERLLAGEIIAREAGSDEAGAAGRMQVLVRAPAQAVWEVIVSCDLAFAFVNGLQECEVLEDMGDRALVHQVVKQSWLVPTYDFVFESLRRPYQRIDVKLLEGNLKALDGHWSFEETSDGTFIDYQIRIQPSLPAPRFIVRRNINKGMPDMLACIRGLAGGSGSPGLEQQDLARCPGPVPPGRAAQ